MFNRFFAVLIVIFIVFSLSGCTKQSSPFVSNGSSVESNTVSSAKPYEPNTPFESIAEIKENSNQETTNSDDPARQSAEKATTVTKPELVGSEASTSNIPKKQSDSAKKTKQIIHASSISLSFCSYESKNEKAPYILSSPIYGVLYCGKRVQIGDSIVLSVDVSPVNHTDRVSIEVSNGLEYTLSEGSLSVTVKQDGNYGVGRVSVYAIAENGSVSASAVYSFVIDSAGDPFADMASILSNYIRAKGMQYTNFSEGYTATDPSKSITHYVGAPAWDDMIDKSGSDWIKQCFHLIDQYKTMGFSKVNFIITDISVGFSAAI